jgi:hypothetical protein
LINSLRSAAVAGRSWARSGMIDGSKKAAARATSRYANIIDCYARRCHSCRRRAAARQWCSRLARRALHAHRFGGCSPAHRGDALLSTRSDPRRSTTGTIARLRPLGREPTRAEQLPPPRPPAPKPPRPPSPCANVTRSRLAAAKTMKTQKRPSFVICLLGTSW